MKTFANLSSQFMAGFSALALSLVLISGTVSIPGTAHAAPALYVGVIA